MAGEGVSLREVRYELSIWEWILDGLTALTPPDRFLDAYSFFYLAVQQLTVAASDLESWMSTADTGLFEQGLGRIDLAMERIDDAHGMFNTAASGAPSLPSEYTAEEEAHIAAFLDLADYLDEMLILFIDLLADEDMSDEDWLGWLDFVVE